MGRISFSGALLISLSFFGAWVYAGGPNKIACSADTDRLLRIPTRVVPREGDRAEAEALIRSIVEQGILEQTTPKPSELGQISRPRLYHASYSSPHGKVEVIADSHGVIENYRLRRNGKTTYWCREQGH